MAAYFQHKIRYAMVAVSISQARFLKWPPADDQPRRDSRASFNLSGEIPQVAALPPGEGRDVSQGVSISQARFLKWPRQEMGCCSSVKLCFNLSGEIPQVAALPDHRGFPIAVLFQSLRRDSSSGRADALAVHEIDWVVSISQARFLKWPLKLSALWPCTASWFQSLRRDSSSGRLPVNS